MKAVIKEKKNYASKVISFFILFIAIAVCGFASFNLYSIFSEYKAGTDEYSKIKNMVVIEKKAMPEETKEIVQADSGMEYTLNWEAPISVDFQKLKAINQDIVGWIYVEAIPSISYPVVQGEDNEYYLHRTMEKQDNFSGTIFIDAKNNKDMSSCNTIVYGHNMKNGSMFGNLKQFKDPETIQKSKYIWMLTPEGNYKYEIFSAYTAEVDSDTYTVFKGPGKELVSYAEKMQSQSMIPTGAHSFDVKDNCILLSTCTGDESSRFVVHAVRLRQAVNG